MAELTTIARPYAKAAFDFAIANNAEASWSSFLSKLAAVVSDESMTELLKNPSVDVAVKMSMLADLTEDMAVNGGECFIESLANYRRLLVLPAIAVEFERLVALEQEALDVTIISAYPLLKSEVKILEAKLYERYSGKVVRIKTNVDQTLIGGFEIRSSDTVIDATIRGRLSKIAASLAI